MGHTIGSRVAVAATAAEAFGRQGNAQLEIGNKDTVVVVIDLISAVPDGPAGDGVDAPSWAPEIVEKNGVPTASTSPRRPRRAKKLQSATLIEGDGATVEKGQTARRQLPRPGLQGKKPFDESYSRGHPASFPIGTGGVIPGWDKALVGAKLGSRRDAVDPARARATARQGNSRRHQGHRHALLRRRHPRRGLTSDQGSGAMASRQERAAAQPADHAAGPAPLRLQGPDPRRSSTPTRGRRRVREDVRARQGGAAQPRRPDRGRQHRPVLRGRARLPDPRRRVRAARDRARRPTRPPWSALATRVWEHARLAEATTEAVRKLTAFGLPVDLSALDIVEPRLTADEPSFDVFWEATQDRTPVEFDYRRSGQAAASTRHLQPWGVVRYSGRWYAVGLDTDRGEERMFRLSRVQGKARRSGRPGSYDIPAGADIRAMARRLAPAPPNESVTVLVRHDAGGRAAPRGGHGRDRRDRPRQRTAWDRLVLSAAASRWPTSCWPTAPTCTSSRPAALRARGGRAALAPSSGERRR